MFDEEIGKIESKINDYKKQGKKIFASSSFQSHSIPMLHILSKIDNQIPIYFLNTGYHFPETIEYKEEISDLLNIKTIDLFPYQSKHLQKGSNGRLLFTSDPDYCCYLNKVQPLEPILAANDVWITGVRADQSGTRQAMKEEAPAPMDTLRYHPMLNFDKHMIARYITQNKLPRHPLEAKGYISIGCEPCTIKLSLDDFLDERKGRWGGMNKNECGLHTELIKK